MVFWISTRPPARPWPMPIKKRSCSARGGGGDANSLVDMTWLDLVRPGWTWLAWGTRMVFWISTRPPARPWPMPIKKRSCSARGGGGDANSLVDMTWLDLVRPGWTWLAWGTRMVFWISTRPPARPWPMPIKKRSCSARGGGGDANSLVDMTWLDLVRPGWTWLAWGTRMVFWISTRPPARPWPMPIKKRSCSARGGGGDANSLVDMTWLELARPGWTWLDLARPGWLGGRGWFFGSRRGRRPVPGRCR